MKASKHESRHESLWRTSRKSQQGSKYELSVIIPVYNQAENLERIVEKLEKTEAQLQVIVVDDGSTDDTEKNGRKLEEKYRNVTFIRSMENKGVSSARNRGTEAAEAPYVGFLDADDDFEEDMYARLAKEIKASGAEVIICNYYEVEGGKTLKSKYEYGEKLLTRNETDDKKSAAWNGADGRELLMRDKADGREVLTRDEAVRAFLLDKISPAVWAMAIRKDILTKFDERLKVGEDNVFALTVLTRAGEVAILNTRLYYYIQNENSAMHSLTKEQDLTEVSKYLPETVQRELTNKFSEEYEFWKMQLAVHSIHAIANASTGARVSNNADAGNGTGIGDDMGANAGELLAEIVRKVDLKKIARQKYLPKYARAEMWYLRAFGTKNYLRTFAALKKIKYRVRRGNV